MEHVSPVCSLDSKLFFDSICFIRIPSRNRDNFKKLTKKSEKVPCCSSNPKSTGYQICVCILICFLSFGSYFCMDNPSALHNEFREDLDMSEVEFMNLYAWYSWPNVVLSFVGGFLIDKA